MKRTHTCGELRQSHTGQETVLAGWVHSRRDHGGLIFIDLRDRDGLTQIAFNPSISLEAHQKAKELRAEYVLYVKGKVSIRPAGTANDQLPTGEVEVLADSLTIVNRAKTPPFPIDDESPISESLKFKYRYLDLRRSNMFKNLRLRHEVVKVIRFFLENRGFIEIETPFLTKSTPEGARDYLIPSRVNPGNFYALPQSPQIFKQILMISGFDRYYQVVRCFRDEDLRADRQPEFTQVDLEMSFVDRDEIWKIMEELFVSLFDALMGIRLRAPFRRLTYHEAMESYGTDQPDLRFGLELKDVSDIMEGQTFRVFKEVLAKKGIIKGLKLEGQANLSRKDLDELIEEAKVLGAKGLVWIKVTTQGCESPITKFLSEEALKNLKEAFLADTGDLLLLVADEPSQANMVLGNFRLYLADRFHLIDSGLFSFLWITDFPLLEYDKNERRYIARHHPFTSPLDSDMGWLDSEPHRVRAKAYDLVLNGTEIGGGSIRIHQREMQEKIFRLIGITPEEVGKKFDFLLDALDFGAPPSWRDCYGP